jgi:tRNA modification GTPase
MLYNDSIVALATPSGAGAIAVIRISGPEAITMEIVCLNQNKDLSKQKTHTLHLGISWMIKKRSTKY